MGNYPGSQTVYEDERYIIPSKIKKARLDESEKVIKNVFGVEDPTLMSRVYWANEGSFQKQSKSASQRKRTKTQSSHLEKVNEGTLSKVTSQTIINKLNLNNSFEGKGIDSRFSAQMKENISPKKTKYPNRRNMCQSSGKKSTVLYQWSDSMVNVFGNKENLQNDSIQESYNQQNSDYVSEKSEDMVTPKNRQRHKSEHVLLKVATAAFQPNSSQSEPEQKESISQNQCEETFAQAARKKDPLAPEETGNIKTLNRDSNQSQSKSLLLSSSVVNQLIISQKVEDKDQSNFESKDRSLLSKSISEIAAENTHLNNHQIQSDERRKFSHYKRQDLLLQTKPRESTTKKETVVPKNISILQLKKIYCDSGSGQKTNSYAAPDKQAQIKMDFAQESCSAQHSHQFEISKVKSPQSEFSPSKLKKLSAQNHFCETTKSHNWNDAEKRQNNLFKRKVLHRNHLTKQLSSEQSGYSKQSFSETPLQKGLSQSISKRSFKKESLLLLKITELEDQLSVMKQKEETQKYQSRRYSPIKEEKQRKFCFDESQEIAGDLENEEDLDRQKLCINGTSKSVVDKHRLQYFKLKMKN